MERQPVHPPDQFLLQEVQRAGFLTFCTSDTADRWKMDPSRPPESLRSSSGREAGPILRQNMYMLFFRVKKRAKIGLKCTLLNQTRLLEGVRASNLVLSGWNTSLDVVKGLDRAMIHISR